MKRTDIKKVLKERGGNYGKFSEHARIAQAIKKAMRDSPNWEKLPDDMKEAFEMEAHKTARILNGNFNFLDSFVDRIGYTQLIVDRLEGVKSE